MNSAIAERRPYYCEYRVSLPNGNIGWMEARGQPIYNETGQCIRVMGLLVDITDRKLADASLRASEERYREVVESQTDLVCRYLHDTTLSFVNDAYCRCFNRAREELIGRKFLDLVPPSSREKIRANLALLAKGRRSITHEHEVLLSDGSLGWQHW